MNVQHQLATQHIVFLFPRVLALGVLDHQFAVGVVIHEVSRIYGVLLYAHALDHRHGALLGLDVAVGDAPLLAELARLGLGGELPLVAVAGAHHIDLYALVAHHLVLIFGGDDLILHLPPKIGNFTIFLVLLESEPPVVFFGGVIFLHGLELDASLLAVVSGIVLAAEHVRVSWHYPHLPRMKFVCHCYVMLSIAPRCGVINLRLPHRLRRRGRCSMR